MPYQSDPLPPWAEGPPAAPVLLAGLDEGAITEPVDDDEDPATLTPLAQAARWTIGSDGEAEWAMAHLAAAEAQQQAVKDQAALWQAKLDAFVRSGLAAPARTIAFFTDRLEQWGRARRAANPDVKTLRYASGVVKTTMPSGPKVIVVNEQAVIDWSHRATVVVDAAAAPPSWQCAVDVPDAESDTGHTRKYEGPLSDLCVTVRESLRVSDLRDHVFPVWVDLATDADPDAGGEWRVVTFAGELVPGCDVEPPEASATAKPHQLGLTRGGGF